eukprot:7243636-Pyramimonas_sp.AAC.1
MRVAPGLEPDGNQTARSSQDCAGERAALAGKGGPRRRGQGCPPPRALSRPAQNTQSPSAGALARWGGRPPVLLRAATSETQRGRARGELAQRRVDEFARPELRAGNSESPRRSARQG